MGMIFHNNFGDVSNFTKPQLRSIVASNRYLEARPKHIYDENDLEEDSIGELRELIGQNYYIAQFKVPIRRKYTKTIKHIPDYIIIAKDYSSWYIVEVEMQNHRIPHLRDQIITFCKGDYSDIEYYRDNIARVIRPFGALADNDKISAMISMNDKPDVILFSDHIPAIWRADSKISKLRNLHFITYQVYLDSDNRRWCRLNDQFLFEKTSHFGIFSYEKITKCIVIQNTTIPLISICKEDEIIGIQYQGYSLPFKKTIVDGVIWLSYASSGLPFSNSIDTVKLVQKQNTLYLQTKPSL